MHAISTPPNKNFTYGFNPSAIGHEAKGKEKVKRDKPSSEKPLKK